MLTCRADRADLDLNSRDTESFKLQDIDLLGVEKVFAIVLGDDGLRIGGEIFDNILTHFITCLLYTSPSPRD